jgi:hypothetical protein
MTPNPYCTVSEVFTQLSNVDLTGDSPTGISFDAAMEMAIGVISRAFDLYTGRKPGAYAVTEDTTRYPVYGNGKTSVNPFSERLGGAGGDGTRLWIGELAAAPTSVQVSLTGSLTTYTTYASTDYIPGPYDALDDGRPYEWLQLDLFNGVHPIWSTFPKGNKITGRWGYSTTPPGEVKMAAIIMAATFFKRGQTAYQDRVNMLDPNTVLTYLNQTDSDIAEMIVHLRRQAI